MIQCTKCGTTQEAKALASGAARLPRGWKRHNGVWCPKCWQANYVIRAITIPVVRPPQQLMIDSIETAGDVRCAVDVTPGKISPVPSPAPLAPAEG